MLPDLVQPIVGCLRDVFVKVYVERALDLRLEYPPGIDPRID